ncbi:MAG TPA: type II toxin-antitoxin system VapC family toxin [Candidatus Baltobacteraceae bacterium]
MIGLDTNVLVRILTRDDPRQFAAASRYIANSCTAESPAFINRIVVVEVVWVLENAYDEYTRDQIADAIAGVLNTAEFTVEDGISIRSVLGDYRSGADFADALIATINAKQGCTKTATFDKVARKKFEHFTDVTA